VARCWKSLAPSFWSLRARSRLLAGAAPTPPSASAMRASAVCDFSNRDGGAVVLQLVGDALLVEAAVIWPTSAGSSRSFIVE
jgi:hypothetical protein